MAYFLLESGRPKIFMQHMHATIFFYKNTHTVPVKEVHLKSMKGLISKIISFPNCHFFLLKKLTGMKTDLLRSFIKGNV